MDYKLLSWKVLGDDRGKLVSCESHKNVPFEIKRVYYIYESYKMRGFHSHKQLEQVAVAICGSCEFVLDDGRERKVVLLDNPAIGLYIGKNIWREMRNFSSDCVLMILASDYYDESDYIRDYEEFLAFVKSQAQE